MQKRTVYQIMRALHRDIGYFVVGMTIIYAFSGIMLIYRDTGFLKSETKVEKQLDPNINDEELGKSLRIKNFKVEKTEDDLVYFKNGNRLE